jgi:hypothetical protein
VLSVWSWFVFGLCALIWLPLMSITWLVTAPFDPPSYWTGYLFRKLPVVHQKLNPLWSFHVSGTMPEDPRLPYVVVSNHESFVDILLISHLPWEMKWLSKVELFRLPFLGWLVVRHRPLRVAPMAAFVLATCIVLARVFPGYDGMLTAASVELFVVVGSAWAARAVHAATSRPRRTFRRTRTISS